mmetsp:Transcript_6149/g.17183  ORF Transcript_6149/g.17183 Transcript_6149/m.17183 type:complete len:216 (-) Transcript_6149:228-875(-)
MSLRHSHPSLASLQPKTLNNLSKLRSIAFVCPICFRCNNSASYQILTVNNTNDTDGPQRNSSLASINFVFKLIQWSTSTNFQCSEQCSYSARSFRCKRNPYQKLGGIFRWAQLKNRESFSQLRYDDGQIGIGTLRSQPSRILLSRWSKCRIGQHSSPWCTTAGTLHSIIQRPSPSSSLGKFNRSISNPFGGDCKSIARSVEAFEAIDRIIGIQTG